MIDERAHEGSDRSAEAAPVLTILYDEFSRLGVRENRQDLDAHFEAINYLITVHLLATIGGGVFPHLSIAQDERLLLRHCFAKYVGGKAQAEVFRDLEKIRTPLERFRATARRTVSALPIVALIAKALELGVERLKAGIDLAKLVANLEESTRDLNATPETDFHRLVSLAHRFFSSVYILVDRVDETPWTQRNPEQTYSLIHPLVGNLALLDHPDRFYAFKFFLWDAVKPLYTGQARPDRIFSRDLVWTREQLIQMLDRRMVAFSDGQVKSVDAMFTSDLPFADSMTPSHAISIFAGTSPRTIVTICRFMVEEQLNLLNQAGTPPSKIGESAFLAGLKKYATDRAELLIPDDKALREILSINRVVFSSKTLNAEVFRGNTPQSVQSKVGKWKRYNVFSVIGSEVSGKRGFPTQLHAFSDPSIAYLAVDLPLRDFLEHKIRVCSNCGVVMVRDFESGGKFQCKACFANVELPKLTTPEEERRQPLTRQLARELAKIVADPQDIKSLAQAASLTFGEDTYTGQPFLIWLRVLQSLAESDQARLSALLEAIADVLPTGSKQHAAVIELYVGLGGDN